MEPESLVFSVGDKLDLKGKSKDGEDTIMPKPHMPADHIVEAVYSDGTFTDPSHDFFSYKSSDINVAEVSKNGVVRFVGTGAVVITVTLKGVCGSTVFKVQ